MTATLSGPVFGPFRAPAKQLVVFLHGVGSDGDDLIGLAPEIGEILPHAAFCSPNAPERCDFSPMGFQWFSLSDRRPEALLEGVKRAAPVLNNFLDAELSRFGLDDRALAVIGFSQGTMTALYAMLRRKNPCAGIVGYSGALLGAETLSRDITARPPVLLVHGDQDPVVPYQALSHAVAVLSANAVPVELHTRPGLGHGIDGHGLALGVRFLQKVFAPAGP